MPSGRPVKKEKKIQTAVRLSLDTHKKISELADRSFRSISHYIEMIIMNHLNSLQKLKHIDDDYDKQMAINKD